MASSLRHWGFGATGPKFGRRWLVAKLDATTLGGGAEVLAIPRAVRRAFGGDEQWVRATQASRPRKEDAMSLITGLHHVTAIAADPQANLYFYSGLLGA